MAQQNPPRPPYSPWHATGPHAVDAIPPASPGGGPPGPGRRHRPDRATLLPFAGAVVLVALAGTGVYALASSAGGCGGSTISLSAAVTPDLAPALTASARRFNGDHHMSGGECVSVTVRSADPADMQTLLSGQGASGAGTRAPDVWIPDSTLWADLATANGAGAPGAAHIHLTGTSIARSPLVAAAPLSLVGTLAKAGMLSQPSWGTLLNAANGLPDGSGKPAIPAGLIKLAVPDPARTAAGLSALVLSNQLLAADPDRQSTFAGVLRTVHRSITPTVPALFNGFGKDTNGRYSVVLAPEQAVWSYNRTHPKDPAVAIYPAEGTATLDYPFTVTTDDPAKTRAADVLRAALTGGWTQDRIRGLGLRGTDGKAPGSFGASTGVSPQAPRTLPGARARDVAGVMQAWSKLSLPIRMLSIFDVSGSMNDIVPGTGMSRIQATAAYAQGGLALFGDNDATGVWVFATDLDGGRPWRQLVPLGPIGDRVGSQTRRELLQHALLALHATHNDTGLYQTVIDAYKYVQDNYQPDVINSIMLFTDGRNDDPQGHLTLAATLGRLRALRDPKRPIQVIMTGYGDGVDPDELGQIAAVTSGGAYVAHTFEDVKKIFLQAISKRLCAPGCG